MIYISKDKSKDNKKSNNNNKTKGGFINVEFDKGNISKRYPNGRTLETHDKFLPIEKKGKSTILKKRRVVVIDSNRNDELAVVRFTTQNNENSSSLSEENENDYKKKKKQKNEAESFFKHFIEIEDNEGKPIKADGYKFKENPWAYDLKKWQVNYIKDKNLYHCKQSSENQEKIDILKSRGKKPKDKK